MSREDSYNIRHDEWLSRLQSAENKAEIIIAKQRHGPTPEFKCILRSNLLTSLI